MQHQLLPSNIATKEYPATLSFLNYQYYIFSKYYSSLSTGNSLPCIFFLISDKLTFPLIHIIHY